MFNIKKKSDVEKMINSAISNNVDSNCENNSSRKKKDESVNVVIEAKVIDVFCEASYNEGRYVSFLRQNIIPFINALGQKVNSCTFKAEYVVQIH